MIRNRTSYVILGILSMDSNKSGYEIRKTVEQSVGYFWGESYGQIYPALKQLAAEGLIVPTNSGSADKKRRQQYALTEAGRACLREWLGEPFHNEPPRNEFLLKLFFGREAAPGVALAHVRELQQRNRQALALLEGIEKMLQQQHTQNPHFPYWMLTLTMGAALARAALDWGESAMAQLATDTAGAVEDQRSAKDNPS